MAPKGVYKSAHILIARTWAIDPVDESSCIVNMSR
jgi:hypothetical protein